MGTVNLLAVVGIVYDIAGAGLLAWALALTRDEILIAQARTQWDRNEAVLATLMEQRHDARFGVALLTLGFALQLLAALGWGLPATWASAAPFGLLVLAVLTGWWVGRRLPKMRPPFADKG